MAWEVEHEFKKAMLTAFARDEGYAAAVSGRWQMLVEEMKDETVKKQGLLVAKGQNPKIAALCDKLYKAGVPDDSRIDAWFQITNAVRAASGFGTKQYVELVRSTDSGSNTAAMLQLDEDFHACMDE